MAGGEKETPPNPAKIEPNSPFFLGPQDRPGDFITPTRLKGDNYDDWVGDIQITLEARRKFVFLDRKITKPKGSCTQVDWNTINAMLVSWIMNTIDPERSKKTVGNLKIKVCSREWPKDSTVKTVEQEKNTPVAEYSGKLSALWEELNN
ncbi:hypothetical protein OSB04_011762 [Centaurea solstitialis]|uniref:Retrotransposon Copia-like N-terminal domain-containing protein n=1 Tax=Centaurea solstitialis TaxID=347529 RepID=A0AA38THM5_9ASTR|nr:hypothetical protein OSB04_011762 [Centaurea solstitialis]